VSVDTKAAAGIAAPGSTLAVGQKAVCSRRLAADDISLFAALSGDCNPVHLDEEYAARTRFGRRIAHGMLVASLISATIANELPGPGSIYLGQTLKFLAPVYPDDTVTATIEVLSVRPDKPIVTLRTTCTNQSGTTVIDGEATVLVTQ
jgi:3-hydroxybutyryl-CoA dehydratase